MCKTLGSLPCTFLVGSKDTYVFNIFHSNFWQLMEEVLVLFTAWRLSQAHSSLIK
jgi:hypothetical protein